VFNLRYLGGGISKAWQEVGGLSGTAADLDRKLRAMILNQGDQASPEPGAIMAASSASVT